MSAPTREDFDRAIPRMVASHPTFPAAQDRYNADVAAMAQAKFTPNELRGMLACAIDRLAER